MNILFTESSLNVGGQELQSVMQMITLKDAGHSVLLACRENSKIAQEARSRGIQIAIVPFRNSLHIPSIVTLLRVIRNFLPDIIICHSGHDSNITGITRWLVSGQIGNFKIIRQKTYLAGRVKPLSLNYLCDTVIVPGNSTKETLINEGCRNDIRVIPPGFDFDSMKEASCLPLPENIRAWLAQDSNIPVILQVGMIRPEKGHAFMLEVLTRLKQQGRLFRWLIVGGGKPEAEQQLQTLINRCGMQDIVLMTGNVSPVFPVYRIASLLVIPSTNESFGMVAVEASAFSLPVMANQIGGLPDIIENGQTGTLLPVGNTDAWVSALNDFFKAPLRYRKMACHASRFFESRFDINRTVQKILSAGRNERNDGVSERHFS